MKLGVVGKGGRLSAEPGSLVLRLGRPPGPTLLHYTFVTSKE